MLLLLFFLNRKTRLSTYLNGTEDRCKVRKFFLVLILDAEHDEPVALKCVQSEFGHNASQLWPLPWRRGSPSRRSAGLHSSAKITDVGSDPLSPPITKQRPNRRRPTFRSATWELKGTFVSRRRCLSFGVFHTRLVGIQSPNLPKTRFGQSFADVTRPSVHPSVCPSCAWLIEEEEAVSNWVAMDFSCHADRIRLREQEEKNKGLVSSLLLSKGAKHFCPEGRVQWYFCTNICCNFSFCFFLSFCDWCLFPDRTVILTWCEDLPHEMYIKKKNKKDTVQAGFVILHSTSWQFGKQGMEK